MVKEQVKILIVEDDVIIAQQIGEYLEDLGYLVCAKAKSGETAIKAATEHKPDLVLMDIRLQGEIDGIEAAEKITANLNTSIIFLTAYADNGITERAKTILPSGYLIKPVQKGALSANIEMALYMAKMDEERRQSEKKLRESESRWRSLTIHAPDYIVELDEELKIRFSNHPYPGLSGEEMLGTPLHECEEEIEKQVEIKAILNNVLKTGKLAIYETQYFTPNGSKIYYESQATAIRRVDDYEIIGVIVSTRDLTRRKAAEIKLRKREAWLHSTFHQAAVGIIHSDLEGKFLRINHRYCQIIGYPHEELLGKSFLDITHPDDKEVHEVKTMQLINGKAVSVSIEKKNIKKDGTHVWVNLTLSLVKDEKGQSNFLLGIVEDITDRIKAEEEQKNMEKLLQQAQKMETIGTLAGGIAHDFNNILHPIIGYSKMGMQVTEDTSTVQTYFSSIHQAAIRAKDLVQRILTFSHQNDCTIETVKMQPIIREVLTLLRSSLPATIGVKTDINEECGWIRADATQIHQIIMNLATNAYHAMQESGGTLHVSLQPAIIAAESILTLEVDPGNYVCLTVADTGTGISADILDKVFDPYFSTKDMHKGTGLGLSIVHGIVNNYNGTIQVSSKPGQGCKVSVYLPVLTKDTVIIDLKKEQQKFHGKEKILVVDDEKEIVYFHMEALKQLGYVVTGVSDSLDALNTFKMDPFAFDLVITDMTMPRLTGYALAQLFLKIRPDLPIILVTGYNENINDEKARAIGIKRFMFKPVDQDDLAVAIRNILDEG